MKFRENKLPELRGKRGFSVIGFAAVEKFKTEGGCPAEISSFIAAGGWDGVGVFKLRFYVELK